VIRARNLILVTVLLGAAGGKCLAAADVVPVNVRTAPGQFDIAAQDAFVAHAVSATADETWRVLGGLLELPAAFSSPVFVRVVDAADRRERFDAIAEPGGVVSVWIDAAAVRQPGVVRRALTRGLLLRLATAVRGADGLRVVPRWLEEGCALWVDTRVAPARLDAVKDETRPLVPPALGALLNDTPALAAAPAREAAALWLLSFLPAESTSQREWPSFLLRVLSGLPSDEALIASYPGRFTNARERELWWQTGWHHVRRGRTLPNLESEESAREIEGLARFVFAPGEQDVVVPLRTMLAHAHDGLVVGEFQRRATELRRIAPGLHPFYRNAGLSLLDLFTLAPTAPAARRDALLAAYESDRQDALELAAAAMAVLDDWEQRLR
jgi:hypothetical protein